LLLKRGDWAAILVLVALWLLFFWRLFTPIEVDQASLERGDFSGQFVAFGAYQYQRFAAGEVPLWNPYNNGGLPFIGDTQAAVFYPPRLLTIALSRLAGGWSYHALELEMAVHVLACSIMMYALVRRMTVGSSGSIFGGIIAATTASYGGFLQSYPPLQLALLEAAIWLPLAVLGIVEATRANLLKPGWLALTGLALGVSWMAGHPQTSFFLTYLLVTFYVYRCYTQRYRLTALLGGVIIFGAISSGLAAVQLLPGFEYLSHTARAGMGFDEKGNGFPFQDLIQFVLPNIVSQWSPLFVGISGLGLALIALWRRLPGTLFWGLVIIVGLGLSLGANSPLFALLYNVVPGLRFFRGQERAAYLVSFALAILAGLGAAHLATWDRLQDFKAGRRIQQALVILAALLGGLTALVIVLAASNPDGYGKFPGLFAFSAVSAAAVYGAMRWLLSAPQARLGQALLSGVLVFELFTLSMDTEFNYDSVPPHEQLSMTPPPLVAAALADQETPFRVDGFRALHDNYGSLYQLADMRGISPLFLEGPFALINGELINPRAWELFAVRYVYTDWTELPVQSEIIASGDDRYGAVNMHRLNDPRPFAHLVYDARVIPDDAQARAALSDPTLDLRRTAIIDGEAGLELDSGTGDKGAASVPLFAPEHFVIEVDTNRNALLTLAHPAYPGWTARVDGNETPILTAYGALSAVTVPAGQHTIEFVYNPLSYRAGAVISLLTWSALAGLAVILVIRAGNGTGKRAAKLG
jgi:hypothetical protein